MLTIGLSAFSVDWILSSIKVFRYIKKKNTFPSSLLDGCSYLPPTDCLNLLHNIICICELIANRTTLIESLCFLKFEGITYASCVKVDIWQVPNDRIDEMQDPYGSYTYVIQLCKMKRFFLWTWYHQLAMQIALNFYYRTANQNSESKSWR